MKSQWIMSACQKSLSNQHRSFGWICKCNFSKHFLSICNYYLSFVKTPINLIATSTWKASKTHSLNPYIGHMSFAFYFRRIAADDFWIRADLDKTRPNDGKRIARFSSFHISERWKLFFGWEWHFFFENKSRFLFFDTRKKRKISHFILTLYKYCSILLWKMFNDICLNTHN